MSDYLKNVSKYTLLSTMLKNPVLKNFLDDHYHYELLINSLTHPSNENQELLDTAFKNYFFEIRFTTYISSLIHFASIDFDKRIRKYRMRNILSLEYENEAPSLNEDHSNGLSETQHEDIITAPLLFEALRSLTGKEKEVLIDSYIFNYSDTEIAYMRKVSQQAISKTKKNALIKLKKIFERGLINGGRISKITSRKSTEE